MEEANELRVWAYGSHERLGAAGTASLVPRASCSDSTLPDRHDLAVPEGGAPAAAWSAH
jgi:hypothetical protein